MRLTDSAVPKEWPKTVRSAMLHIASLAHGCITYSRSWAADSAFQRVRLAGQLERARNEVSLLRSPMPSPPD